MSMVHWVCDGIGIRTNELYPYLNKNKCINFICKQVPNAKIDADSFDIDQFFDGNPFENLGDMLCHADDTNTLTFDTDGQGEYYFYYRPLYPWQMTDKDPVSLQEVHERIIDCVLCLCDMSRLEAESFIDNAIYDYGFG